MKPQIILLIILFIVCNGNYANGQIMSKDKIEYIQSLITHINDSTLEICDCWIDTHQYSSVVPHQRLGVKYAKSIESAIDSSFAECSTISKNDSLFILSFRDMEEIKKIYTDWFYNSWLMEGECVSIPKKALEGSIYKWVDIKE